MRLPKRMVLAASTLFVLTTLPGCDDSKPSTSSSSTEATVKGVVRIDGKPAESGEIVFDPSNYQRPSGNRTAPIGKDGSYVIKTLVGVNTIKLSGDIARKAYVLQNVKRSLDVQAGENTYDFEVSAK